MEAVQLTRRTDGKIRATEEEKRKVLDILNTGAPIAEVSRTHGLTIQTLVKWRRGDAKKALRFEHHKAPEPGTYQEMVSEIRKLVEENQKLRKALGNVAYDRDILQETYTVAVKKKVDLARTVIASGRFKIKRVCRVLEVARSNQYLNRKPRPKHYKRSDAPMVLKSILEVTQTRGTDGYPRVTARINRERRKAFLPLWNEKRIYRMMSIHKLLLPKKRPVGTAAYGKSDFDRLECPMVLGYFSGSVLERRSRECWLLARLL